MANRSLEALKAYFYEHAYPTWQQFHDVLDSFRHKNDKIPITDVDGLADQLNGKASADVLTSIDERVTTLESAPEDIATKFVNASLIYDDDGNLVTDDDGFIVLNDYILPSQLV